MLIRFTGHRFTTPRAIIFLPFRQWFVAASETGHGLSLHIISPQLLTSNPPVGGQAFKHQTLCQTPVKPQTFKLFISYSPSFAPSPTFFRRSFAPSFSRSFILSCHRAVVPWCRRAVVNPPRSAAISHLPANRKVIYAGFG